MIEKVLQHYRMHLGDPARVWKNDLYSFKVLQFDDRPFDQCVTYATVGLCDIPLARPNGLRGAQELVFLTARQFVACHPEDLLFVIGGDLTRRGLALRNGEILGPAGPLVRGASVEALLCTSPPYFPDEFDEIDQPCPIIVVGLIPITTHEAKYAETHGWKALQGKLVEEQPDLPDLSRESMGVCSR